MNCKQGDLAIVVHSESGLNAGKIVRCVRWVGTLETNPATGFAWTPGACHDFWEIDPPLLTNQLRNGKVVAKNDPLPVVLDSCLRPIRGDLLDEETEREFERVVSA